jgi:hypothetical protein
MIGLAAEEWVARILEFKDANWWIVAHNHKSSD